jgi:hypothetical protein
MRFAAKEAVLKALGTGFSGMRFTDVEVVRDASAADRSRGCRGARAERAEERGIVEMHLSLSFTHTTAVASAVAITEEGRPKPKEVPPDPLAELAASFKEARALLDDGYRGGAVIHVLTAEGARAAEERAVAEGGLTLAGLMDRAGRRSPTRSPSARLRGPWPLCAARATTAATDGSLPGCSRRPAVR